MNFKTECKLPDVAKMGGLVSTRQQETKCKILKMYTSYLLFLCRDLSYVTSLS